MTLIWLALFIGCASSATLQCRNAYGDPAYDAMGSMVESSTTCADEEKMMSCNFKIDGFGSAVNAMVYYFGASDDDTSPICTVKGRNIKSSYNSLKAVARCCTVDAEEGDGVDEEAACMNIRVDYVKDKPFNGSCPSDLILTGCQHTGGAGNVLPGQVITLPNPLRGGSCYIADYASSLSMARCCAIAECVVSNNIIEPFGWQRNTEGFAYSECADDSWTMVSCQFQGHRLAPGLNGAPMLTSQVTSYANENERCYLQANRNTFHFNDDDLDNMVNTIKPEAICCKKQFSAKESNDSVIYKAKIVITPSDKPIEIGSQGGIISDNSLYFFKYETRVSLVQGTDDEWSDLKLLKRTSVDADFDSMNSVWECNCRIAVASKGGSFTFNNFGFIELLNRIDDTDTDTESGSEIETYYVSYNNETGPHMNNLTYTLSIDDHGFAQITDMNGNILFDTRIYHKSIEAPTKLQSGDMIVSQNRLFALKFEVGSVPVPDLRLLSRGFVNESWEDSTVVWDCQCSSGSGAGADATGSRFEFLGNGAFRMVNIDTGEIYWSSYNVAMPEDYDYSLLVRNDSLFVVTNRQHQMSTRIYYHPDHRIYYKSAPVGTKLYPGDYIANELFYSKLEYQPYNELEADLVMWAVRREYGHISYPEEGFTELAWSCMECSLSFVYTIVDDEVVPENKTGILYIEPNGLLSLYADNTDDIRNRYWTSGRAGEIGIEYKLSLNRGTNEATYFAQMEPLPFIWKSVPYFIQYKDNSGPEPRGTSLYSVDREYKLNFGDLYDEFESETHPYLLLRRNAYHDKYDMPVYDIVVWGVDDIWGYKDHGYTTDKVMYLSNNGFITVAHKNATTNITYFTHAPDKVSSITHGRDLTTWYVDESGVKPDDICTEFSNPFEIDDETMRHFSPVLSGADEIDSKTGTVIGIKAGCFSVNMVLRVFAGGKGKGVVNFGCNQATNAISRSVKREKTAQFYAAIENMEQQIELYQYNFLQTGIAMDEIWTCTNYLVDQVKYEIIDEMITMIVNEIRASFSIVNRAMIGIGEHPNNTDIKWGYIEQVFGDNGQFWFLSSHFTDLRGHSDEYCDQYSRKLTPTLQKIFMTSFPLWSQYYVIALEHGDLSEGDPIWELPSTVAFELHMGEMLHKYIYYQPFAYRALYTRFSKHDPESRSLQQSDIEFALIYVPEIICTWIQMFLVFINKPVYNFFNIYGTESEYYKELNKNLSDITLCTDAVFDYFEKSIHHEPDFRKEYEFSIKSSFTTAYAHMPIIYATHANNYSAGFSKQNTFFDGIGFTAHCYRLLHLEENYSPFSYVCDDHDGSPVGLGPLVSSFYEYSKEKEYYYSGGFDNLEEGSYYTVYYDGWFVNANCPMHYLLSGLRFKVQGDVQLQYFALFAIELLCRRDAFEYQDDIFDNQLRIIGFQPGRENLMYQVWSEWQLCDHGMAVRSFRLYPAKTADAGEGDDVRRTELNYEIHFSCGVITDRNYTVYHSDRYKIDAYGSRNQFVEVDASVVVGENDLYSRSVRGADNSHWYHRYYWSALLVVLVIAAGMISILCCRAHGAKKKLKYQKISTGAPITNTEEQDPEPEP